jgi:signal transduction histidine kinase
MSLTLSWPHLRTLLSRWRALATAPPPPPEVFLSRIRFVERGVGLPVKAVVLALLTFSLFFSGWLSDLTDLQQEVLGYIRMFFLFYFALNVGSGLILWGMDEVSARLVVPVTCIMTILDGAMLGLLTLVTGGFDSILYWAFLGLLVRNAAVIPSADVQITVNFLVSLCYLLAGILDIWVAGTELELIRTTGRGTVSGGFFDESQVPIAESLILRMLLMLLLTACCAGIQILVDRQRQREFDAQEFQIKQQQLEAAGRLAAEIAHQLKNPLGIINNAAFTLQRTVKEGKKITQQISIIREEVDRSDKILTELMGYARLSEGRVERVDINAEVDRAVDLVLPAGANFEIKIHRDYAPGLPALLGQQGHFAEVFANLLTNAREAMDGKGEIFLTTRTGPEFSVVVSIRDTGPGIPADQLKSIFEPYFTTKNRGTGLGLAIVKNNTELYGGTVAVESELGKGTMFTLTLPARSLIRLRS